MGSAAGGGAGDLTITIGGDLTPLETALAQLPTIAEEAFGQVQSAVQAIDWSDLDEGIGSVSQSLENLGTAAASAMPEVEALADQLDLFAEVPLAELPEVGAQLEMFATYAGDAATAAADLGASTNAAVPSIGALGTATEEADGGLVQLIANLGGGFLVFQALKSAVEEMTTAYGDLQRSQIALSAILGNTAQADAAIDSVKQLADTLGIAQDAAISTQQKLVALGEPLQEIPRDMTAIADGAAAMNTSFDTAAQRFDQIVNSGSLMARSLTSIGLSTNDVAAAMGEAGVPATILTTQFKNLDEQQRAAILSSAELTKNMGVAAAAASGVVGSWNDVKNAIESAFQVMGQAVGGFSGLATAVTTAVNVIAQAFVGLTATIKIAVDAGIALVGSMIQPFKAVGEVITDALAGNFAEIPNDIKAANSAIQDSLQSGLTNIQSDVNAAGNSVATIWGASMASVATSTAGAVTQSGAALNLLQVAAQKAASDFAAVSLGFAAGRISEEAYTASLTAMNKAQEDANGGLEQLGTAILIVANNFRQTTVDLANANTNLTAIKDAIATGASNWTAYDAALKQLNTDQMAFNNGQQDAHTALLMAKEDFQNMGVASGNAQTNLDAVTTAMATGTANLTQYTAALQAAYKAQLDLNGGVATVALQLQMAENSYQNAAMAAQNAANKTTAYAAALKAGYPVLQQTIDAMNGQADAANKAAGGLVTWKTAGDALLASQMQVNLNLQSANTTLAKAKAMLDDGSIGIGVYTKALEAQKAAQEAVNGTTQTAATSTPNLSVAQEGLTAAFGRSTSAIGGTNSALSGSTSQMSSFATNLQIINGQMVIFGQRADDDTTAFDATASGLSMVNGQFVQLGQAAQSDTTFLGNLNSSVSEVNGQFIQLGGTSGTAAAGISSVGTAAKGATQAVQSLSAELDTLMGDESGVSLGASLDANSLSKIGSLSMSLTPGQTYTQPFPGTYIGGTEALGQQDPSEIPNTSYGYGETEIYDPADAQKALTQAATAATAAVTDTTAAVTASTAAITDNTTAVTASTVALGAVPTVVPPVITSVQGLGTAALNAGNSAAVLAANTTTATTSLDAVSTSATNLGGVLVSTSEATTAALNSLTTASTAAAGAAMAIVEPMILAAQVGQNMANALKLTYTAPQTGIGYGSGVGGTANVGTFGGTSIPTIGSTNPSGESTTQPVTINLTLGNNGIVVGQNGMQQLATMVGNNLTQQLGSIGIKLNRQ